MENWRRNARVLWVANFIILGSMSMVLPFLALFLGDLGVQDPKELSLWTGATFSATFLSATVMAPIWGVFADKYGQRANLIRAAIGMGLVNILMSFTTSALMLLMLRLVMGVFSGFITVAFSYLSKTTPREHVGQSLGFLQTGGVAGGIIGPLIGGVLADWFDFRTVFLFTGTMILITTLVVLYFLPKDPPSQGKNGEQGSFKEVFANPNLPILFLATFMVQAAVLSTNSMMTIFVKNLVGNVTNIAFLSGLAMSITGIANIIASPFLGKLGDRVGQSRVLPVVMLIAGVLYLPQLWTQNVYELYFWRFLQGLVLGGMFPAIQALIKKRTPEYIQGRAYGINSSFTFLGNLTGPIIGGLISGHFSVAYVFVFAGFMLLVGGIIVKLQIGVKEAPVQAPSA